MKHGLIGMYALSLAVVVGLSSFAGAQPPEHKQHHKRGHHHFIQMDTNKDGKVSEAEFHAKGAEKFARMDANSDGFITEAEAKKPMKHTKPVNNTINHNNNAIKPG